MFTSNPNASLKDGNAMTAVITSPKKAAVKYASSMSVSNKEETSIAVITLKDESPSRASDFLKQLAICYNHQANDDKNQVAYRTEEFINSRLEKINAELNSTEGELEAYKKRNRMVELDVNSSTAFANGKHTTATDERTEFLHEGTGKQISGHPIKRRPV